MSSCAADLWTNFSVDFSCHAIEKAELLHTIYKDHYDTD